MKNQLRQFEESLAVAKRIPKAGQLHKLSRGDQQPAGKPMEIHTAAKENSVRNHQETGRRILQLFSSNREKN